MKEWRKLQWARNRAYISLRFSELLYAGLNLFQSYLYNVKIGDKKIIIKFKREYQGAEKAEESVEKAEESEQAKEENVVGDVANENKKS
ncbi:MAG: hypothetical protein NZ942_02910 [Candidatus Aenigmarchaeota archaeon]|nr:hypothetical protein [Candidatus Aenigmarchaeota archaeon]